MLWTRCGKYTNCHPTLNMNFSVVCYVNEIANVLCNECNGSEHVSVHNYFIRIVYVIKSSSSKLLMPRFCSSMQIPSCFVPTPIWFASCAWVFLIRFSSIMCWCYEILLRLVIMLIHYNLPFILVLMHDCFVLVWPDHHIWVLWVSNRLNKSNWCNNKDLLI